MKKNWQIELSILYVKKMGLGFQFHRMEFGGYYSVLRTSEKLNSMKNQQLSLDLKER